MTRNPSLAQHLRPGHLKKWGGMSISTDVWLGLAQEFQQSKIKIMGSIGDLYTGYGDPRDQIGHTPL